jgi:hypothetical protein
MKRKSALMILTASFFAIILIKISNVATSNSANIRTNNCEESGYDAIKKLNTMVEKDLYHREYYEVIANADRTCIFMNYNMKHQIFSFGLDRFSGFGGVVYMTKKELHDLSLRKISKQDSLIRIFYSFPKVDEDFEIPTRTMDMIQLY